MLEFFCPEVSAHFYNPQNSESENCGELEVSLNFMYHSVDSVCMFPSEVTCHSLFHQLLRAPVQTVWAAYGSALPSILCPDDPSSLSLTLYCVGVVTSQKF